MGRLLKEPGNIFQTASVGVGGISGWQFVCARLIAHWLCHGRKKADKGRKERSVRRASEARVAMFTYHSSVYIAIKMAECAYVTLHDIIDAMATLICLRMRLETIQLQSKNRYDVASLSCP